MAAGNPGAFFRMGSTILKQEIVPQNRFLAPMAFPTQRPWLPGGLRFSDSQDVVEQSDGAEPDYNLSR
jgi:hypothetical protein